MTDDSPPDDTDAPDADTLAIHAVLDGEAGAEERRRVAADPGLLARLAAARAAQEAVASPPVPPDDGVLAAARARALDEALGPAPVADDESADESDGTTTASDPDDGDEVVPIEAARDRRGAGSRRRLPPLPAVAAVVLVLVLVGVGLLLTDDGDDNVETAADSSEATTEESLADDGSAQEGAQERSPASTADDGDAGGDAAGEAPAAADPDVADVVDDLLALATATYPTPDDLLVDLRTVDPETLALPVEGSTTGGPLDGGGVRPDDAQVARCDVINSNQEELDPATAAVIVDIDGTPVVVTSNHDPRSDATRLTVMELPSCVPLGGVAR